MSELEFTLDESDVRVLKKAYAAFNARDLDAALATMQPNVEWPNGMEGWHGRGPERRSQVLDSPVEPD